jgi:8-oxo-dGTP pyrophosphatase MutT (NUDIX family)
MKLAQQLAPALWRTAPPEHIHEAWNMHEWREELAGVQLKDAAVLCGVIEREQGPTVLLTKRRADLRDHAGQVALPGGRIEAGELAHDAAVREASEEVGLVPEQARVIGWLEPYVTISGFRVWPVVAELLPPFKWQPSPTEVEAVFEAPLKLFVEPEYIKLETRLFRGKQRSTQVIDCNGFRIWGATAAMLTRMGAHLR